MKKIIVYLLSLIISCLALIYVFNSGVLHPKIFTLNKTSIHSPANSVLFDVNINGKNIQNIYSPLYFNNKKDVSIKKNDNISIIFLGLNGTLNNLLSIESSIRTEKYFNSFTSVMKKRHSLSKIESKPCIQYLYSKKHLNSNSKNIIMHHALLFNKKNHLFITIQSDKKTILENALSELCQ